VKRSASAQNVRSLVTAELPSHIQPNYMKSTASYDQRYASPTIDKKRERSSFGTFTPSSVVLSTPQPMYQRPPSPVLRRSTPKRERIQTNIQPKTIGEVSVVMGFDTISVPNYRITSFLGMGVRGELKLLYIQNNYLLSFKYLNSQPELEMLHVGNNCICSFFGLENQPKLQHILLEGNPITKHPYYRLMCLIAAGTSIKKIDDQTVTYKEREFVKRYISNNPLVVEAIRAGWLLDLKPRSSEEYTSIVEQIQQYDLDDKSFIQSLAPYQELLSDSLQSVLAPINVEKFDPKDRNSTILLQNEAHEEEEKNRPETPEKKEPQLITLNSPDTSSQAHMLLQYSKEIKQLRAEVTKRREEVKEERKKIKKIQDSHISSEDISMFKCLEVSGLTVIIQGALDTRTAIDLSITQKSLEFRNDRNYDLLYELPFSRVHKTSLLMDDEKEYRIHMRLTKNMTVDIFQETKSSALTIYKVIHMFIVRFNKTKNVPIKEESKSTVDLNQTEDQTTNTTTPEEVKEEKSSNENIEGETNLIPSSSHVEENIKLEPQQQTSITEPKEKLREKVTMETILTNLDDAKASLDFSKLQEIISQYENVLTPEDVQDIRQLWGKFKKDDLLNRMSKAYSEQNEQELVHMIEEEEKYRLSYQILDSSDTELVALAQDVKSFMTNKSLASKMLEEAVHSQDIQRIEDALLQAQNYSHLEEQCNQALDLIEALEEQQKQQKLREEEEHQKLQQQKTEQQQHKEERHADEKVEEEAKQQQQPEQAQLPERAESETIITVAPASQSIASDESSEEQQPSVPNHDQQSHNDH